MTDDESKKTKGNAIIMIVVLLAFGLILGGVGLHRYNDGKRSASWPTTKGSITQSRPQPVTTENNRKEFRLSVSYSYKVDGKPYTGQRVTSSDQYEKTRGAAESALKKYPVGGEVTVYYDPDNPASAVLETGIQRNVYILLLAGACCCVLAVLVAVSALKKFLKGPAAASGGPAAEGQG